MYGKRDKKSADCPNQRIVQRRPKANPCLRCKRADRVCGCPSTRLKQLEQAGFGNLSARAQNNGWRTRGGQLRSERLGVRKVASVCHRNRVYRAKYQDGSANLASVRFVADLVPFVAKC